MQNNSLINKVRQSIKSGDFLQRVKGYFTYGETIIRMKMDLEDLPELYEITPFRVREINPDSEEDRKQWVELIDNGYDEEDDETIDAVKHFENHLFLDITNTYFVMDQELPVATISIGPYKNNRQVGGDARISVRKSHQGHGLGKYVILYGFHKLREQGISQGETMISVKRTPSIYAHFFCGFRPETDLRKCQYKDHAFYGNRVLANRRLIGMYDDYQRRKSRKGTVEK